MGSVSSSICKLIIVEYGKTAKRIKYLSAGQIIKMERSVPLAKRNEISRPQTESSQLIPSANKILRYTANSSALIIFPHYENTPVVRSKFSFSPRISAPFVETRRLLYVLKGKPLFTVSPPYTLSERA